jgi:hypothetical protein
MGLSAAQNCPWDGGTFAHTRTRLPRFMPHVDDLGPWHRDACLDQLWKPVAQCCLVDLDLTDRVAHDFLPFFGGSNFNISATITSSMPRSLSALRVSSSFLYVTFSDEAVLMFNWVGSTRPSKRRSVLLNGTTATWWD